MAAYFTQHLPSPISSRHLSFVRHDGRKTTIIPPLTLSTAPASIPASTGPTVEPPPHASDQHAFDLSTLAHFLHAFHTHYGFPCEPGSTAALPTFDLAENKTGYTIYGSLAGLRREDVHVETDDLLSTITVSGVIPRSVPPVVGGTPPAEIRNAGEKPGGREGPGKKKKDGEFLHWHVEERRVGPFCRVFHLPVGLEDMACVEASMQDGLLCVTVPKTVAEIYREEVSQRRRVEVGGGEGEK